MNYTDNYNLRKPEPTDPVDIQDLNYNADAIDGKLKEIEDWEAAHLQASNPHSITPEGIGAETPTGAQQKADQAETNAKSYADIVANSTLNSAINYADDVLESANSYTNQVASYLSQKLNETRIKVLDVERDVSNISKVLTSLNPNQEAKQSVSGYGILSLPKNAANGQVSVTGKGNTWTNLLGSANKPSSLVSDATGTTIIITTDGGIAFIAQPGITEKTFRVINGHKYFAKFKIKPTSVGSIGGLLIDNTRLTNYSPKQEEKVIYNATVTKEVTLRVSESTAGQIDFDYAFVYDLTEIFGAGNEPTTIEQCEQIFYYISGTKSTLGAIRLKSVGKNIWGSKKAADDVVQIINNSNYAYLTNIDGRNCLAVVGSTLIMNKDIFNKFKPNTQYTIQVYAKRRNSSYNGGFLLIKYTDGSLVNLYPTSDVWSKLIYTSVPGKTIESIQLGFGLSNHTTYFDYDTLQLEEGTQATEYEPYKESVAYITAKNPETGEILELRSLPNGVKDEFNVVEGKYTKKVSDTVSVSGTMFASLDTTTYVNVDIVKTTAFSDAMAGTTGKDGMTRLYDKNGVELTEVAQTDIDNTASVGKYYWHTDKTLWIVVAKGAYADIAAARTGLGTMTLNYQLATPIEIPIQMSGSLVSYPSGTVYIEPFVADAGIYTDKMEVLYSDLPIKALEKISKVDFNTGLETELDITAAVIAEDKLSFTHPDLVDGDIVFFTYKYDRESTEGETEIEYYDSRYVIKDSVTGKFYKWHIAIADGVPSIELTEV